MKQVLDIDENMKKELSNLLRNMFDFYRTYSILFENLQQPAANSIVANRQQVADNLRRELFSIPWDHQCRIVSKCKRDPYKALFFVRKTIP